jgi:hypothetical protein
MQVIQWLKVGPRRDALSNRAKLDHDASKQANFDNGEDMIEQNYLRPVMLIEVESRLELVWWMK